MNLSKSIYEWCLKPAHLFFIAIAVLILPNIALCATEGMPLMACLTNIFMPLGVYWLAMTLAKKPGKMIWWLFLFIFLAAFQLVLLYLFGRGIIAVDMFLNLVTTNPGEAMELLDNLVPAVVGVFVVYLPVLILGIASILNKQELGKAFIHNQRVIGCSLTGIGLFCLGGSYACDNEYMAEIYLYPANVIYNIALAGERTYQTEHYAETSRDFSFCAKSTVGKDIPEIYVMVIGETARACEFQLYGYNRTTTPLLAKEKNLVAFSNVMTQSNTTHKSVPMLMSAASAVDYDRIYKEKGIIEAFKECGFHTTFISNQKPNHSFIDFFGEEADEWHFIKEEGSTAGKDSPDAMMLNYLRKTLAKGNKKEFIVLHCYGSHFNYRDRYPREYAFFKLDDATEAKRGNREQLINAYDNTIRYTDALIHGIIEILSNQKVLSAMLYTSDHGENIFDDDRNLFLHASPTPSYYELHVPFLVWTSDKYNMEFPNTQKILMNNSKKPLASSASLFHSMLGMARIKTIYLADSLNVGSTKLHSAPRHYLSDHNKPVTLDKVLHDEKDFSLLKQHHVDF